MKIKGVVMKFLIFLMALSLSTQVIAAPRAYYSGSRNELIVNGREASSTLWGYGYSISGEFSDHPRAHQLYEEYRNMKIASGTLLWSGFAAWIIGAFDDNDRVYIGGALTYIVGVFLSHGADMKLYKAINIYNGVPEDLAFKSRDSNDHYSSNYGLSWRFEF